jgi:GNAT superfamily N-acetyltransferase
VNAVRHHGIALTDDRIEDYLSLTRADDVAAQAARVRSQVAAGKRDLADTRLLADESGAVVAAIRVFVLGLDDVHLNPTRVNDACAAALVAEAMERVREIGATRVLARVHDSGPIAEYVSALQAAGFMADSQRVEFKTPVDDLPDESGSPLTWRTMADTGRAEAVRMLAEVVQGDPGWGTDDDPALFIERYLARPALTGADACVQIGYLDGSRAAFVFAQTEPKTGWCTITEMGLLPAFRGRGLGRFVQRRGFAMLREQGGTLYHDGCEARNAAMLRLFESHGCVEYSRLTDWVWRA